MLKEGLSFVLVDPSSIIEQLDHLEEQLAENKQLRAAVEEYEAQQLANKTQGSFMISHFLSTE